MRLFKKNPPHHFTNQESPLYELALATLGEHRPHDPSPTPTRQCRACQQPWPCPRYQLALAAEIQIRSYESHKLPAPAIPGSPDRAATTLPDPACKDHLVS